MLVSEVHPVAILSPLFCVTCSAVSCLSEIIGAYIVTAYSSMGLVTVLYVFIKVSLFLPQWVEVRAFSILINQYINQSINICYLIHLFHHRWK